MRVAVLGISGSGKTTFATRLAQSAGIAQIELDLLNWRPGWVSRYDVDFDGLAADLEAGIAAESWVVAGGYSKLRDRILRRADTVVWLDLPKWLVLWQVLGRSVYRATTREPMLNGNVESFGRWLSRGHPIQLVWSHFQRKRKQFRETLERSEYSHLRVYHCCTREEVAWAIQDILATAE